MQQLHENFFIAGQLSNGDFATAKQEGITLVINNRPDGEGAGILSVAEAQQIAKQHGIRYLHLPMANGQPLPEDLIPSMQLALDEQKNTKTKVLAHCRTGTRSSFLWGAVQVLEGSKSSQEVIDLGAAAGVNLVGFAPFLQSLET